MRIIFSMILIFLSSCASYPEDLGGFVSTSLAGDPLKGWGVDQPKGKVKKLTTYYGCKDPCGNHQVDLVFFLDTDKRVYKLVQDDGDAITEYSYIKNATFPFKEVKNSYGRTYTTVYGRDKYENKISINDKVLQIKRKGNGYETYNDGREMGLGEVWRYYEEGLLLREESLGAEDVMSKSPIEKTEEEFEYKRHNNGVVSEKKYTVIVNGSPVRVSIDYYSDVGLLTHRWVSRWGNINIGSGQQWIDYSYDNYGNWLSRKWCQTTGGWNKFESCTIEKRSIEYY